MITKRLKDEDIVREVNEIETSNANYLDDKYFEMLSDNEFLQN
jgi:hypothetical protein